MPSDERIELLMANKQDILKQRENRNLVVCLESFIRALARLFVLAELGDDARRVSASVGYFFRLDDTRLGTKGYQV